MVLWLPLKKRDGSVFGVITSVISADKKVPLSEVLPQERDLHFLQSVTNQIASALENSMLYEQVVKHTENVEETVERRTQELSEVNAQLEAKYAELKEAQAKLVSSGKMAALGEMAGGIAHEINTPFTSVISNVEMSIRYLKIENPDLSEIRRRAEIIVKTGFRIGRIITGLKTFSRDGEKDPMQLTPVKNIVEETLTFYSEKFKEKSVALEVSDIPDSIQINCRAIQISQVLLNLLNNSFDAVQKLEDKWVKIDGNETESTVIISVTDSGAGIPKELHEKIFQPFFTTKDNGKGTGLGLSVSKGLIDSHSGRMKIDSNSRNTKILIWLPKE